MNSTEGGKETDLSERQSQNAPRLIVRSLESAPNAIVRRREQEAQQPSGRTSTEDGMQIDSSALQLAKAKCPINLIIESDSNSTRVSLPCERQQNGLSVSIEEGITIDSGDPITQISERTSKSTKKSFRTRNESDPSSISIQRIPLTLKTRSPIIVTEAGIENRSNNGQNMKAELSIVASRDGGSNVTDRRDWQEKKQFGPRRTTKAGIAMDRNESQFEKADREISLR
jgi:hypothetical protein